MKRAANGRPPLALTVSFSYLRSLYALALTQVTLFPALIVLDQRRIDAKKHFLCPCCITVEDFEFKDRVEERVKIVRRVSSRYLPPARPDALARQTSQRVNPRRSVVGVNSVFDRSTFVDIKGEKTTTAELSIEAFLNYRFGPFLTKRWVQALVLIVAVGISCISG